MTAEITLPFWPTCQQNLQWSDDNLIAVAGGTALAILVPRLDLPKDDFRWDNVVLKIDGFTDEEIPIMMPLSRRNWSISEEVASRVIASIRWSSPGLGLFDSCVLGVLFSDHALVLWTCTGRPETVSSWNKVLIVNDILRQHYTERRSATSPEDLQVGQRIRAFAWHHERERHLLAVTSEAGDILFLHVQPSSATRRWTATIVQQFSYVTDLQQSLPISPFQWVGRSPVIDLAWSDNAGQSKIAYIRNGVLCHCIITLDAAGRPDIITEELDHVSGPLQFIPGSKTILFCRRDYFLAYSLASAEPPGPAAQVHLETAWSEVSGLTTSRKADGVNIHLACHLGNDKASPTMLSLTHGDLGPERALPWHSAVSKRIDKYKQLLKLKGDVQLRTHGLASMPMGNLVSVCISTIPADSIVHIINAHQECTVIISNGVDSAEDADTVARSHAPVSALLLNLVQQADKVDDVTDQTMKHTRLQAYLQRKLQYELVQSPRQASEHTALQSFLQSEVLAASRAETLAKRLVSGSIKSQLSLPAYRELVTAVLQVETTSSDIFSQTIVQCFQSFQDKLSDQPQEPGNVNQEHCSICLQPIEFEAVRWARCKAGHKFARCAVTLTVLQPGMSKSCLVCSTQTMNEHKLADVEGKLLTQQRDRQLKNPDAMGDGAGSSMDDSTTSLARTLLETCSTCLMCGGKFTLS